MVIPAIGGKQLYVQIQIGASPMLNRGSHTLFTTGHVVQTVTVMMTVWRQIFAVLTRPWTMVVPQSVFVKVRW